MSTETSSLTSSNRRKKKKRRSKWNESLSSEQFMLRCAELAVFPLHSSVQGDEYTCDTCKTHFHTLDMLILHEADWHHTDVSWPASFCDLLDKKENVNACLAHQIVTYLLWRRGGHQECVVCCARTSASLGESLRKDLDYVQVAAAAEVSVWSRPNVLEKKKAQCGHNHPECSTPKNMRNYHPHFRPLAVALVYRILQHLLESLPLRTLLMFSATGLALLSMFMADNGTLTESGRQMVMKSVEVAGQWDLLNSALKYTLRQGDPYDLQSKVRCNAEYGSVLRSVVRRKISNVQ